MDNVSLEEAQHQLRNALYAASGIIEQIEYQRASEGGKQIRGNGHHMRQKIAEYGANLLAERWSGGICRITGSEITFDMNVSEKEIKEVAQDIWDHPSKYSDYSDGSDHSFYSFLKYLDIKFPDGHEERLSDFVNTD